MGRTSSGPTPEKPPPSPLSKVHPRQTAPLEPAFTSDNGKRRPRTSPALASTARARRRLPRATGRRSQLLQLPDGRQLISPCPRSSHSRHFRGRGRSTPACQPATVELEQPACQQRTAEFPALLEDPPLAKRVSRLATARAVGAPGERAGDRGRSFQAPSRGTGWEHGVHAGAKRPRTAGDRGAIPH